MSNERKNNKNIEEKYNDATKDPIKYGIITSLNWYGNLNLTRLSKLLKKHESTTFRYIKKLVEDGLIEIDLGKTTNEWGKYYKLTPAVKKIYGRKMEEIEIYRNLVLDNKDFKNKTESELNDFLVENLLSKNWEEEKTAVDNYLSLIQSIQSTIISDIFEKLDEFKGIINSQQNIISKNSVLLKPIEYSLYTDTFQISKFQHLLWLYEIIFKFQDEIKEVVNRINRDMDKDKVPAEERISQILHLFSANIDFTYEVNVDK